METKQRLAAILVLILSLMISSCGPEQLIGPTQTQTPHPTIIPTPTLSPTPIPTLPPGVINVVQVSYFNSLSFHPSLDSFTNHEVIGEFGNTIILQNTPDDSRAPVYGLSLQFSTDIEELDADGTGTLETVGPPVYKWFFGDVPEEPIPGLYSSEAYIKLGSSFGARFIPGFDASLTYDNVRFSEASAQTVTLSIVPRQLLNHPTITIHLDGGKYGGAADVVVTSLEPGEHRGPAGERIIVTPDRKNIYLEDLPLSINKTYIFSMTLRVDPYNQDAMYKPYIAIAWDEGSGSSTTQGSELSLPVETVGIWTWTSVGEYLWEWEGPGSQYEVTFN